MVSVLPGWSPANERTFKEILFRFLEEVQCTKAALYLRSPDDSFVLATQYGFGRRDLLAAEHGPRDPLAVKVRERRTEPWLANRPDGPREILDYLAAAGTSRLLLVPLYHGVTTFGFVDARDKSRRRPFEPADLQRGRQIADELLEQITAVGLYDELTPAAGSHRRASAEAAGPPSPRPSSPALPAALLELLEDDGEGPVLDERGALAVLAAARSGVLEDGVAATVVTVATPRRGGSVIYLREGLDELDVVAVHRHQEQVMRAAGADAIHPSEWRFRRLSVAAPREPVRTALISSALPCGDERYSLLVSVVGSATGRGPGPVLATLCDTAAGAAERARLRFSRRRLARRLLEPGTVRHDELVVHSLAVSRLTHALVRRLGWDEAAAEEAAVAGLLHDVGMRELDYDALYRNPAPTADAQRTYRRHVTVGESLVAGLGLNGVGPAVRHHHERWDGRGYPDRLEGSAIPLLARVIHLAEVWDTLTSAASYRPQIDAERALAIIRAAAGQQFDPELVPLLAEVVR